MLLKHVMLPLLAPAAIVGLYLTPVSVIGCVNRGLLALAVVFVSLIVGLVLAVFAIRARRAGDSGYAWLGLAAAILAIPAILVLGPLG